MTRGRQKSRKMAVQKNIKNHRQNILQLIPKGHQNAAKNGAKTHQKLMQKKREKQMRKIIENPSVLKCKNMQIYGKGHQN